MWALVIKKAEHRRMNFWTVVLEKTLESPLDCKEIQPVHPKGNQSWIFIGRTDAEAAAPIFWPPDPKSWFLEWTLVLDKIEGRKKSGQQRMRWLDGITDAMDMSLSRLWDMVKDREVWRATVHGVTKRQTWLSDWTVTTNIPLSDGSVYFCITYWRTTWLPPNLAIMNKVAVHIRVQILLQT